MNKIRILASLTLIIFLSFSAYVSAHPPSDIMISFDPKTKVLTAVVMHYTSNPSRHYIKKIDIGINGKKVFEEKFLRQDNNENRTIEVKLGNFRNGDIVSVEAYCSISGKLKREIKPEIP